MNLVRLIGHLGQDAEVKTFTKDGETKEMVTLSIATSNDYKDGDQWVQRPADWHRVTVFKSGALGFAKALKKGAKVEVKGPLKYNRYTDKDGIERFSAEILVQGKFDTVREPKVAEETEPA